MLNDNEISACVRNALNNYFRDLDGEAPHDLYEMVMPSVERPLITLVLERAGGNQTLAAEILGISRNTLRKKMQQFDLNPTTVKT